jgi:hypothetical protein
MIYAVKCDPEVMDSGHIFKHLQANSLHPEYVHCGAEPDDGCDSFLDPDTRSQGHRFIYIKYEEAVSDTADLKAKVVEAINSYIFEP